METFCYRLTRNYNVITGITFLNWHMVLFPLLPISFDFRWLSKSLPSAGRAISWLTSVERLETIAPEWDLWRPGYSMCHTRDPHTATGHLLSHGQASGTACLLLYEICHCPVKVSGDCQWLTCFDNSRGASAFETVPEKCTYLLTSHAEMAQKIYYQALKYVNEKSARRDANTARWP